MLFLYYVCRLINCLSVYELFKKIIIFPITLLFHRMNGMAYPAVILSYSRNMHISIITPCRTPLVLHDPVTRGIANEKYSMIDRSICRTSEYTFAIPMPIFWCDRYCKGRLLQKSYYLRICDIVVIVRIFCNTNTLIWTNTFILFILTKRVCLL